jgi:hypothetical protein
MNRSSVACRQNTHGCRIHLVCCAVAAVVLAQACETIKRLLDSPPALEAMQQVRGLWLCERAVWGAYQLHNSPGFTLFDPPPSTP